MSRTYAQLSLFSLVRAPNGTPCCVSAWRMTSVMALMGINILRSRSTKKSKTEMRTFPNPPRSLRCRLRGRAAPQRTCCCERKRHDCVWQDRICGRCPREYWDIDWRGIWNETFREQRTHIMPSGVIIALTAICTNPYIAVRRELSRAPAAR